MLTRGELIMAQPVEHLKAAGYYLRMRQSRSTPVAVDDDLVLSMSCVSTEAEGITDMTTTSKPLRPSRSRGASGTKTKIELVPGESSDLEDPELLFHELENAEPPESPTAGGDAPVQPGSFSVAGGSASASTGPMESRQYHKQSIKSWPYTLIYRPAKGQQPARYQATCPCLWHVEV